MLKCILTVGIPASGKSTWAKSEVAKDPNNWVRVNNDQLRDMMNGSVWSQDYEKMITDARNYLIRDALKRGKNLIIDNLNLNKRHFDEACKIAKSISADTQVFEKAFYIEIEEAMERNAKREGAARVPDEVMKKWYKESGKEQFKFYKPRVEIFTKQNHADRNVEPMVQDKSLPRAIICDIDGSICKIVNRSPYDTARCLDDVPNAHVVELVQLYYKSGFKIIFCSGRDEEFRELTQQWLDAHTDVGYKLFMRPNNDKRKDVIVKEEIFNNHIKGKYFVAGWFDDRLQIVKWLYETGFPVFRIGDPEASF